MKYDSDYNSTSSSFLVCRMKYRIEPQYVEHKKIIIENENDTGCLCRVNINHRLFKIVYLEPHSVVDVMCDTQEETEKITVEKIL